ncbi:MAG: aldehyde dehydrogenase family protein [Streptosporangiales bacterium]|nr:aldehyde dehydrogenase family protein [Streptosporangiales bacterium]
MNAELFIEGGWTTGESTVPLLDKYDGKPLADVHVAGAAQVKAALRGLDAGWREHRLTAHQRYTVLARASALLAERREEFTGLVVRDTGFTVTDAEREVDRAVQTLLLCGEEARRLHGEMVPMEGAPGISGRYGFTLRHPLGVVVAITPFNSPLNTVAHKVGPALAAGNAVLLKPAEATPLTAAALVRLLLDAGLPAGLIALVNGPGETVGQWLLDSPVPAFYAFTGSTAVGKHIRRSVGLRKSQLEMGGLSSTIVCADAGLEPAAGLCVNAAFRKAGQVCTSVQRLYVEASVADEVGERITALLAGRGVGDPYSRDTFVGPVISEPAAERIESWIGRARDGGATVVTGGTRRGTVVEPTVLSGVRSDMDVMCREIFGPVVTIRPFRALGEAIAEVNDTPYGLAAGIFTADLRRALDAAEGLRMGSVHINETSSSRVDLMPYGGVKSSGLGLEGPRYAVEEMTEQRLITIGRP